MCTALVFSPNDHYFGRNLDLEVDFGEEVVVTPRNYPFSFRQEKTLKKHHALIGIALIKNNYPLYFDAVNEKGLAMAGLNYPGNAHYYALQSGKNNISPFEFIPWILGQAANLTETKLLLQKINLVNIDFSPEMQLSPLHWIIADKSGQAITIEADSDGMHVYDNPVGVLTNNPRFDQQLFNLNNYSDLSPQMPQNNFSARIAFAGYSRGLGSRNLPGGMDSESRFVRATFAKYNAPQSTTELSRVNDLFHIMQAVAQPKGLDEVAPDKFEYTIYTSGANLDQNLYYFTSYENQQINCIDLNKCRLDDSHLQSFAMSKSSCRQLN